MQEIDLHNTFQLVLILIMLAAGVTAIAKKLKQPYPIALVIVGALIGLMNIPILEPVKKFITEGEIFNFVIITLFLPALLGEASLKLPYSHLKENKKPILVLAFGGTLISFLVTGFASRHFLDLPLAAAFVFGSLMSATDPVSVLSIFKTLGVRKKLAIVIEGESLFNDGLAVVLFNISAYSLIKYIDAGFEGLGMGLWDFVRVISLGLIAGGVLGYAFSQLTRLYDDYPLEIIFSMILFYGSFLAAEHFHASGVIAVVVAAIIFGNYGARIGMSPTTKLNIHNFWDVAAHLANSIVFLMVGLEITRIDIHDKWGMIFAAIVIVLAARSAAVYISMAFIRNFPPMWLHILNWGGLKGSLSIALVMSLPRDFPAREEVLVLAFSVVLFSLVVQGLTIKPFIRLLGITSRGEEDIEYEGLIAKLNRYETAIEEINRMKSRLYASEPATREILAEYNYKIKDTKEKIEELFSREPSIKNRQLDTLRKHVLYAENEAIEKLERDEIISARTAENEREEIVSGLVKQKGDTH
ncbi:cation:proton antiporter [Mesobacillus zeae]|uniref:Sodium:proton antiporter n=1 Tax=Mesobacillus zeae TaxID=1917180 RepID=A0A398BCR4_9BACI|nr:cation:proton antiporter [Mesobacillus zeae]RID85590.1 sodium:proton antiporter [Mesobacillus zeae]